MDSIYRFGIEEEYFLADGESRGTPAPEAARAFHAAAGERIAGAGREVLQSQVEISTKPGTDFDAARRYLADTRGALSVIGRQHGLLVFASGTHPLACWPEQTRSEGDRYQHMVEEYGILATRNMVCALHVHVEVPDAARRSNLMCRMLPYLPLFLALSASSPFWEARPTGLAAYRMAAYSEWPRSGLPDLMEDAAEYERYLHVMTASGAIPDASFLWWALRPSMHYPTLELRVCDSCFDVAHSVAIAALYRCTVRMLDRREDVNHPMRGASRAIAAENLWRVQRHGVQATLIDEASARALPFPVQLDILLELVAEDAAALGCDAELQQARAIVSVGTGADRQREVFDHALAAGLSKEAALRKVVDWLASASTGTIVSTIDYA